MVVFPLIVFVFVFVFFKNKKAYSDENKEKNRET